MPFDSQSGSEAGKKSKRGEGKLTKTFKELLTETIHELQEDEKCNMLAWAQQNPTEFYKIASKLIPTEVVGKDGEALIPIGMIEVVVTNASKDTSEQNPA